VAALAGDWFIRYLKPAVSIPVEKPAQRTGGEEERG
jgi:hypothetical protein